MRKRKKQYIIYKYIFITYQYTSVSMGQNKSIHYCNDQRIKLYYIMIPRIYIYIYILYITLETYKADRVRLCGREKA